MENRRTPAIIALAGVVLAVVLFLVLKDDTADRSAERTTGDQTAQTQDEPEAPKPDDEKKKPDKPPEPELPVIEIEGGQPVGGPQDLDFTEGETIEFEVVTDTADELHLHGYDQYVDIAPGKPTDVKVDATIGGVFELESHSTGVLLAEISVNPS